MLGNVSASLSSLAMIFVSDGLMALKCSPWWRSVVVVVDTNLGVVRSLDGLLVVSIKTFAVVSRSFSVVDVGKTFVDVCNFTVVVVVSIRFVGVTVVLALVDGDKLAVDDTFAGVVLSACNPREKIR